MLRTMGVIVICPAGFFGIEYVFFGDGVPVSVWIALHQSFATFCSPFSPQQDVFPFPQILLFF